MDKEGEALGSSDFGRKEFTRRQWTVVERERRRSRSVIKNFGLTDIHSETVNTKTPSLMSAVRLRNVRQAGLSHHSILT